jgi:hypothetical protein
MVHQSMYITRELFELRHALPEESLPEAGVPLKLCRRWLRIDNAFMKQVVRIPSKPSTASPGNTRNGSSSPNPLPNKWMYTFQRVTPFDRPNRTIQQ